MTDPDFDLDIDAAADGPTPHLDSNSDIDADTHDMFGPAPDAPAPNQTPAPSAAPAAAYQVLARKYRPRTFEDLIGQEAMVRTLSNAFAADRIAHAFMLTGVRGVGKTTTARLLARALNFESATVHRPTVDLTVDGRHCASIIEGRNMDVLELDAATRTKVDDMRELLDGVRYAPVEARYKVYIIDEVHMLSTAAFNALLKTLEEPPPHAKFIFATTEIRKVPVTILSRCQRFDLRRVEPEVLVKHLEKIAAREGAVVDADGLALIARAAEGSVRDALSLLDQAIVQTERGQPVAGEVVRDMLGLADRSQTIALFEAVTTGQAAQALAGYRTLYGFGADPAQVVGDLLEHAHAASVGKTLGRDALSLPNAQAQRLTALGAQASAAGLARMWQMLLKAYDEVRRAPNPSAAVEMALIRLCYAANLPGPEEALKALQSGEPMRGGAAPASPPASPGPTALGPSASGGAGALRAVLGDPAIAQAGAQASAQTAAQAGLRPLAQAAQRTALQTFEDVLNLIDVKRDVTLKLDVERYIRLVDFKPGVIAFEPAPGAPANLPQRLSGRLKEWTGQPWMMDIQTGGQETAYERDRREEADVRAAIEADPFVAAVRDAFPGAEIIAIRSFAAPHIGQEHGASSDEASDADADDD